MQKKKSSIRDGIVFSTNPDFKMEEEAQPAGEALTAAQQKLRIRLDTRQRAGKSVTLIEGFSGPEANLGPLEKKLKIVCGTGGSVKDGAILIQGDQREKVLQWLLKNGYKSAKKI
jgi:translation initiation factor 1